MREKQKHLTPEVAHLLAAVKAVKDGLVPEYRSIPVHEEDEPYEESDEEEVETKR